MVCTFFGHRDCPELKQNIRAVLAELIVHHQVDIFYVGCNGLFDSQVRSVLKQLSLEYPHIHYAVVLSAMPGKSTETDNWTNTMLPEGIEEIHPKFAIDWRNR